ncbi:tRNA glutamyl-Q(34) synthetase GluQRS [Alteromonas sediminis]|uniref:tRNA glutamyl-Q(34) synthetase GluQRS n=1 Tax=Alteromonas sediminis TaxID=2259342 RepID=A0A3N5XY82_9ALTE|nr:tRNA glutamyl-Q(34) synthetase GluQRS [Alteromonas sediminis]RPJ64836.1 tRNA glutamyl-Q(34) synthetase GluQRS [Alteromonas sediminis]
MEYIGRFAPSPTGPLHFGSLVAALASYLDARAHNGQWLLRMEDVDMPRCQEDAPSLIRDTLHAHGMQWHTETPAQSARQTDYHDCVSRLLSHQMAYFCECTRKQIKAQGGVHNKDCRDLCTGSGAVRLLNDSPVQRFTDRFLGETVISDLHALEDTVLRRRDGLYSYNLAVVVDDIAQNVTHVVRGEDLLDTTSAHLTLYRTLNATPPTYLHIPIVKDTNGNKLSKQNHAPALRTESANQNLREACAFLGLSTTFMKQCTSPGKILDIAVKEWRKKCDLLG